MSDRSLHGLGMRLQRDFMGPGLTPQQDWLLSAVISELEYRRRDHLRRKGSVLSACVCWLCLDADTLTFGPS